MLPPIYSLTVLIPGPTYPFGEGEAEEASSPVKMERLEEKPTPSKRRG